MNAAEARALRDRTQVPADLTTAARLQRAHEQGQTNLCGITDLQPNGYYASWLGYPLRLPRLSGGLPTLLPSLAALTPLDPADQ